MKFPSLGRSVFHPRTAPHTSLSSAVADAVSSGCCWDAPSWSTEPESPGVQRLQAESAEPSWRSGQGQTTGGQRGPGRTLGLPGSEENGAIGQAGLHADAPRQSPREICHVEGATPGQPELQLCSPQLRVVNQSSGASWAEERKGETSRAEQRVAGRRTGRVSRRRGDSLLAPVWTHDPPELRTERTGKAWEDVGSYRVGRGEVQHRTLRESVFGTTSVGGHQPSGCVAAWDTRVPVRVPGSGPISSTSEPAA
nr:uncharacterized protein LOC103346581 [Oryctolagus cuniculus]